MDITGARTLVNVAESRHGQTWEGRYIYPHDTRRITAEQLIKTKIRCPLCDRRFLRKLTARPQGRVLRVEGPPDGLMRQPVIYDPLPRSLTVLICTSAAHEHGTVTFVVPHRKFREMESATKVAAVDPHATSTGKPSTRV